MTQFSDIPVGAYFTLFPHVDSSLCVKLSNGSSAQGYGAYRFVNDPVAWVPYLIAHWCDVTPRSDTVIIRRDRDTGAPIAFVPEGEANPGMLICYAHVGQHSEACRAYYASTKPAHYYDADVEALVRELVSVGYAVHLVKRLPSWRVLAKRKA